MFNRTTSTLGVLCVFARVILYPIFSSWRQACPEPFLCQDKLRRRDAKTAKKNIFLFLRTWRPLRLCGSPRGISFPQKRYLFIHGIISRGEPRGIPTRPRSSCSPEALFHGASHRLSGFLNPNLFAIPKGMCPRSLGLAPRSPDGDLLMNFLVCAGPWRLSVSTL